MPSEYGIENEGQGIPGRERGRARWGQRCTRLENLLADNKS